MKKKSLVFIVSLLVATMVASVAYAATVGLWQCTVCGMKTRITHPSTELGARDYLGDGHVHQWKYLGR